VVENRSADKPVDGVVHVTPKRLINVSRTIIELNEGKENPTNQWY
jgi:hypothetical protein